MSTRTAMTCWAVMAAALGATTAIPAVHAAQQKAAKAPGLVSQIKVLPDKAPDCSSLKSMVESITRECKTNDEKAIAIYNFMQLTHYHFAYPGEPGGLPVLKEINCYGWSLCGGLHSEQSALWRQLGWGWRFVGWNGHTTVEANYDGKWHYLDAFLKFYAWKPDPNAPGGRTIASEDELTNNSEELIRNAFVMDQARKCVYAKNNQFGRYGNKMYWLAPSFLCCGDELEGVIGGLKTHHRVGPSEGWAGIVHDDRGYSADVNLAPGFALTNTWDAVPDAWYWGNSQKPPAHTCGAHKDTRNDPGIGLVLEPYVKSKPARSYSSGTLTFAPDFSSDAVLKSFVSTANVKYAAKALVPAESGQPGVVVVDFSSPYLLTKANGEAAGADAVEVSTDGGKTFNAVDLKDFTEAVRGQVAAQVKITFKEALKTLQLDAIVQNNSGALPYLSPGKNVVTVSVADPKALGENKLVVTYAYRSGSRSKSFEQMYDEDKEIAKAHDATWDDTVTCVQKTFTAGDLPAKFEIDCPTPKGRYPVYPRMLFVRRELLAPGQTPAAVPAAASTPKVGPNEELATLPSPWLIGTQLPPAVPVRATRSAVLPVKKVAYVTKKGEVFTHQFVKWLKDDSDAWVMLIDFGADKLPKLDDLASAKLALYVEEAHEKAPMQVAVVVLDAPFEPGQPYDFAKLGKNVGSTIVQKGIGGPISPPKRYEIDVTMAMRAWAGVAKCHGLAVRIVPNRG
ncbi:MAG: hypothetical protein HQ567_15355, partial [Candidatus Nealsonbacteria bacterium]|nr:hypothetical protein [Candidatus Nealsonbacteria bacterium]